MIGVTSPSSVDVELDLPSEPIESILPRPRGASGESPAVTLAIRDEMFAPKGPNEWMMGSFSSSGSSSGSLSSLSWLDGWDAENDVAATVGEYATSVTLAEDSATSSGLSS